MKEETVPTPASDPVRQPLRLLVLEDSPADTELEIATLERGGYACQWERVQTRDEFADRVAHTEYDLILADYRLPAFDGLSALRLVRNQGLDLPFVLISGTLGEESAIESLKAGATDYVLKDRLQRLVPVVRRALAERAERRQREQAELAVRVSDARYRELFENANDIVYTRDLDGKLLSLNKAGERLTGFSRKHAVTMNLAQFIPPAYLEKLRSTIARQLAGETLPAYELEVVAKDGRLLTIEANERLIFDSGKPVAVHGIARDITARKRAEADKAAMLDVAREITGSLDLAQLLDRVQRLTARVLHCDAVATMYWDPARQVFRVVSHHGIPAAVVPYAEALTLARDAQWNGRLVTGSTLVLNDIAAETWWPAEIRSHFPVASLIAAPLDVHDRHLGALIGLRTTSRRGFDEDEVQLCAGIAQQLALGLESVELYGAQQEEANVSGTLARVGRALISSLDTPVLLNCLCQLVTEELKCDFSHALLSRHDEPFSVVAGFGDTPEQREALQLLKVPRESVEPLLGPLDKDEVAVLDADTHPALNWLSVYHGAQAIYVALRRRHTVVGILIAGYRGRSDPFRSQQQRIMRGIGQLASMALENACLLEELESANRLKSDFVATMSHELRTPLNIIMGYGDLLRDGEFGELNPEQLETFNRMDHSAKILLELVTATLDLSRLEGGRALLQLEEVVVRDLMAEVMAETADLFHNADLTVTWNVAPDLPLLCTDSLKLKMVIKNLVDNAVKFTPRGSVTIDVRPCGEGVEVAVTDTGIGIAPEVMPIIFEPFRQGDRGATRRFGGVGLGLYIVQRLVEMLGATILVESEVDRGSVFRVVHPLTAGHGARPSAGLTRH